MENTNEHYEDTLTKEILDHPEYKKGTGWNQKKVLKIIDWMEEFKIYRLLHSQVANYYGKMHAFLSLPSIIISAIAGAGLFTSLSIDDKTGVILAMGVLVIISTILQGINEFYGPGKLANLHSTAQKQYAVLISEADEQITQEESDRENGSLFLKSVRKMKNELIINSPNVPKKFWDNYFNSLSRGELLTSLNRGFLQRQINFDKQNEIEISDAPVESSNNLLQSENHDGMELTDLTGLDNNENNENNQDTIIEMIDSSPLKNEFSKQKNEILRKKLQYQMGQLGNN